jgi:hypothetical protein
LFGIVGLDEVRRTFGPRRRRAASSSLLPELETAWPASPAGAFFPELLGIGAPSHEASLFVPLEPRFERRWSSEYDRKSPPQRTVWATSHCVLEDEANLTEAQAPNGSRAAGGQLLPSPAPGAAAADGESWRWLHFTLHPLPFRSPHNRT